MNISELNGRPLRLLIGGSPCTHWSIAQKNDRETIPQGLGWELFNNYLIAKDKFKPHLFLYENNKSASKAIKNQISKELGVDLMYINSNLLSAQTRQRFYVFNWDIEQPTDKGILLNDIFQETDKTLKRVPIYGVKDKSRPLSASYAHKGSGAGSLLCDCFPDNPNKQVFDYVAELVDESNIIDNSLIGEVIYEVKDKFISIRDKKYLVDLDDGYYKIRKYTVEECCRLQTMPSNYCKSVSPSQAYKCIGNGWTAEVIIYILKAALKHIPRDYPIEVLSMYDGIGTGRYCLEQLGFTNVTYKAYEIDKYAITVANDNYPDIIQCGDAFNLRKSDWMY